MESNEMDQEVMIKKVEPMDSRGTLPPVIFEKENMKDKREELEKEIKFRDREIEGLKKRILGELGRQKILARDYVTTKRKLSKQKKIFNLLEEKYSSKSREISELERNLEKSKEEIDQFEAEVELKSFSVEEKNGEFNELRKDFSITQRELDSLKINLKHLDAEINQKSSAIKKLEEEVRQIDLNIKKLDGDIKSKELALQEIKGNLEFKSFETKNKKEDLKDVKEKFFDLQEEIKVQKTIMASNEKDFLQLDTKIKLMDNLLRRKESEYKSNNHKIEIQELNRNSFERRIMAMGLIMEQKEDQVRGQKAHLNVLKKELENTKLEYEKKKDEYKEVNLVIADNAEFLSSSQEEVESKVSDYSEKSKLETQVEIIEDLRTESKGRFFEKFKTELEASIGWELKDFKLDDREITMLSVKDLNLLKEIFKGFITSVESELKSEVGYIARGLDMMDWIRGELEIHLVGKNIEEGIKKSIKGTVKDFLSLYQERGINIQVFSSKKVDKKESLKIVFKFKPDMNEGSHLLRSIPC